MSFTDVVVDFFGALMPGAIFVIGFCSCFFIPASIVFSNRTSNGPETKPLVTAISQQTEVSLPELATSVVLFSALSFVIGTIFFRLSPKRVDQNSVKHLRNTDLKDGMVREDCIKKGKIEYPYTYLKAYLEERNLRYLSRHIPWNESNCGYRTKHFINALKIRILASEPDKYHIIARNEAHIRLASSLWYVSLSLLVVAIVSFVTIFAWFNQIIAPHSSLFSYGMVLTPPLVVAILAYIALISIEKSFHYQRVREILHILELANWLHDTGSVVDIFKGINPQEQDPKI